MVEMMGNIQTGLDVAGMVPVVGEIADGANALIYLGRGDYTNAGLSAAAMVPFIGWGATGGKLAKKVWKGIEGLKLTKVGKIEDAVGGLIIKIENSPYLIVRKGNKTFHISPDRVKEYIQNPLNPNSKWGDQINFKKYGVPEGSEIIQGAGKGHKRTPTADELKMFNNYFKSKI